jgi:hypothetical protein
MCTKFDIYVFGTQDVEKQNKTRTQTIYVDTTINKQTQIT